MNVNRKTFIRNLGLLGIVLPEGAGHVRRYGARDHTGSSGSTIVNAGKSGNNTRNLLARVDKDCLALRPSLVILMVGTNDMNSRNHVPLAEYEINLLKLADHIENSGSNLLMLSILPFYEPYLLTRHPADFYQPEGPSARRTAVNDVIRKVAHRKRADFLDIGSVFEKVGKIGTDKDSLIQNEIISGKTDGVHPTPNGYRFIGLALSQFIVCNKLPTEHIVCFGDSITRGDGSVDKESYPAYLGKLL